MKKWSGFLAHPVNIATMLTHLSIYVINRLSWKKTLPNVTNNKKYRHKSVGIGIGNSLHEYSNC